MKTKILFLKSLSLLLASAILFSSCSSTTLIQSSPPGAKVYLDGSSVGTTPYYLTDSKIVGSETRIRLEKEGYNEFTTVLVKDEEADIGAIIGGCFVLVPFLWTLKYKDLHVYDLTPSTDIAIEPANSAPNRSAPANKSKAERLRELKQLLDEKIITQEEFDKEKKKILDEDTK